MSRISNTLALAPDWEPLPQPVHPDLLVHSGLVGRDPSYSNLLTGWYYVKACIRLSDGPSWYLYARDAEGGNCFILGVFDTEGQLDFFLSLHRENPLKVPGLRADSMPWPPVTLDDGGELSFPRYVGVYLVGMKSYRVEADEVNAGLYFVNYRDRYHTEYLGEASEKDACLLLYSHFDARLRGCKMC